MTSKSLKYSSFKTYCSAVEKLASALQHLDGQHRNWNSVIVTAKKEARKQLPTRYEPRAYADPKAVVAGLDDAHFRLVALIQLHCGTRVSETTHITANQLLGNHTLLLTNTKGGRVRNITVPPEIYEELETQLHINGGTFTVDRRAYRTALHHAATMTGQQWHGTHALRWNYVQKRVEELQRDGKTYDEALVITSQEIGHSRAEITTWYLR